MHSKSPILLNQFKYYSNIYIYMYENTKHKKLIFSNINIDYWAIYLIIEKNIFEEQQLRLFSFQRTKYH